MRTGIYYLNSTGSRWVVFSNNGKKEKITLQTRSGKTVMRTALFYEQCGNFAVVAISYKGKIIKVFTNSLLDD